MKLKIHWPFKNTTKPTNDSCINTYDTKHPLQQLACILLRFLTGAICIILLPVSLLNLLLELIIEGLAALYAKILPSDADEALTTLKLHKMKSEDGPHCDECDDFINCKCGYCMYLGRCFNCPSSDCEEVFEDQMHEEHIVATEFEEAENQLNETLKESGMCDACENSGDCKCD